mmetsp:Transcript_13996/g.29900  ORF Transcript_13996/g.29900 Transcript_13996/m.29900 type:complete len:137 (+) Transcript_13996:321-731(+)
MEGAHFIGTGGMTAIAFHLTVETVTEDEMMGHFYAVGFHGVGGAVVEVADVGLVEVRDALFGCRHCALVLLCYLMNWRVEGSRALSVIVKIVSRVFLRPSRGPAVAKRRFVSSQRTEEYTKLSRRIEDFYQPSANV